MWVIRNVLVHTYMYGHLLYTITMSVLELLTTYLAFQSHYIVLPVGGTVNVELSVNNASLLFIPIPNWHDNYTRTYNMRDTYNSSLYRIS